MGKQDLTKAIPPEDYKGSIGKWITELQERGLWDGENPEYYCDVLITKKDWWKILSKCES